MVTSAAARKAASKSTASKAKAPIVTAKGHHGAHPPWIDMIKECITITADGSRHGVSRPVIKKFVAEKYHVAINPTSSSQLNRAISHGAEKGDLVLPKGTSGKIKLAPKRHTEATKENTHPASKKSTALKEESVSAKATTQKTAATKAKVNAAARPTTARLAAKRTAPAKKYTSSAKKARTGTGTASTTRAATAKAGAAKKASGAARKTKRSSTYSRTTSKNKTRSSTKL